MYHKNSPATIQSMFNTIANRYDLTNAVLSFSLHKWWNRSLVQHVLNNSLSESTLVDLCAGTGDIAFHYLRSTKTPCQAYLVDFSSEMLEYAKSKAAQLSLSQPSTISYVEADVQQLPLPDQLADHVTMAYGIRNVQHPENCIREAFRILKPGGCFGILELTRPRSSLLRLGHQIYLRTFLPLFGKWLTDNREAYQYLCQSIQTFIPPKQLDDLLRESGFIHRQSYSLLGGIATILIGYRPSVSEL